MRRLRGMVLLLVPFILTGCWDNVELNERHVIFELAVDKNTTPHFDNPDNEQAKYEITYSVPDIGKLSGADSLAQNVKMNISIQAPTIASSIDQMEVKTQNTLTFSHAKALIFGEELLKEKDLFKGSIDALLRDMKIGRSTIVLATRGLAGELTKTDNPQNPIIGMYVMKYFNNSERPVSVAKGQLLGNLTKELSDTGISTIPIISSSEEDVMEIKGAALIRDYEVVEWLDQEVVRGQLFIEGKIKHVPIVVNYKDKYLTYTIDEQKSKVKFTDDNGKWTCHIQLDVTGDITEYLSSENNNIFSSHKVNEITQLLEQQITRQATVAVEKSQALNVDFLNIGLEMYRKHPKKWKAYADSWHTTSYKDFPIQINTTINIQNTGVLQ